MDSLSCMTFTLKALCVCSLAGRASRYSSAMWRLPGQLLGWGDGSILQ